VATARNRRNFGPKAALLRCAHDDLDLLHLAASANRIYRRDRTFKPKMADFAAATD
jgi:hypothetical protein